MRMILVAQVDPEIFSPNDLNASLYYPDYCVRVVSNDDGLSATSEGVSKQSSRSTLGDFSPIFPMIKTSTRC